MTVGRAAPLVLVAGLLVTGAVLADEPRAVVTPTEVRVLSAPGASTVVTVQATPDAHIEDRTPGAHPAAEAQGPASVGETFSDEITFIVRDVAVVRQAAIDVADALVSTVRLFPDPAGMQVVVFVRQPVTYAIARPTATGAIAVTLRPRTVVPPPVSPSATTTARPGRRQPRPKVAGEDQVAVDAAELSYDQQANVLVARGGVTLTRGATTLRADEVRYDRENSVAEARGHVVLVDPEATVEGDAARLDLDDETGWIDDANGDMKQSPYRLSADHIEKHGGPCYTVRNGIFTTCRCGGVDRPEWSIAAGQTEVTVGGVGVAKDAKFRVEDVPVLYFPYLIFPANTDRQSGLLMPQIGYSSQRGFVYQQPIYWAIDKSSDATVTLDLETAARVGVITEYRYRLSKNSGGVFGGGYFNEQIGGATEPITPIAPGTTNVPVNRWIVAGRHRSQVWPGAQVYLEVLRVSDDQFLREIRAFSTSVRSDIQVRSTRFTRSRLGGLQTWDGGAAQVEATSYQDLIDPQRFALNEVPRIAAEHALPVLGGLAVARLAGETVDFQREQAFDGLRVDLAPELFVPLSLGRYLSASVRGQARETAYHLSNTEPMGLFVPNDPNATPTFERGQHVTPDLDTNHTREIGQVNARLGTEIGRIFDFPYLGLAKIRHTIEPEVQYLYVPQVATNQVATTGAVRSSDGQAGVLFSEGYLFDEVDAIRRRNFVSYGLTTRIVGRGAAPAAVAVSAPEEPPAEVTPLPLDGDGDEDDDAADETLEEIDPDTLPQGLPADALPPVAPPPPKPTTTAGATPAPAAAAATVLSSRELFRASLLQGYDVSRDLTGNSHFSDVDALVRVTPVDWAGLSYNMSVNLDSSRTLARSVGLVVRDPTWTPPTDRPNFQSPTTAGVAYRFIANTVNSTSLSAAEQRFLRNTSVEGIDGSFYLRITDYVGLGILARYDLSTTRAPKPEDPTQLRTIGPHFLERDAFVRFISRCNCWLLEAGVSDRSDTNDVTFRVQFTLYGLGSFGQSPATRGYAGLTGLQNLGFRRPRATGGYQ